MKAKKFFTRSIRVRTNWQWCRKTISKGRKAKIANTV